MNRQIASDRWHALPIADVYGKLETDTEGLTAVEAGKRLETYGPNRLPEQKGPSRFEIALDQIRDPLIYILIVAGGVALALGDIVDAVVILAVVVLNGIIGFVQETRANAAIVSLKKLLAFRATVIREDSEEDIDAEELVPGDIILLRAGQRVPADVRLFYAKGLRIDQSMLTGESVPVEKISSALPAANSLDELENLAFMGTNVASGHGRGLIVSTGSGTELGKISQEIGAAGPVKTPIEHRMESLSRLILLAVLGFSAVGFVIGFARGQDLLLLSLTLVALAVAAVPEGLPVAMTIALAAAVNRMARQKAIIRHLPAIETLGSCTTIGSDKTGTLTRNEMTVRRIRAENQIFEVNGLGYTPEGELSLDGRSIDARYSPALEWTLRTGLLCNESTVIKKDGRWIAAGDPTEAALIVSARKAGLDQEKEMITHEQLDMLPFEAERRYMATLNLIDDTPCLLVKGSPEALVELSAERLAGHPQDLRKQRLIGDANQLAATGLRVLAMAYRRMPHGTAEITHEDVSDLTFAGLQGMLDPPRPEAVAAIKDCGVSGIRVLMITGDNALTAGAIADEMGLTPDREQVLTGHDIDNLDGTALRRAVAETPVFARVSPAHKLRIVQALADSGEIVAVTGDGVNDAPALKAAHIGVAMGITGTDVAKEASDMVVLDDNFASIYQAVINGRVAFDNLRKVTFFLLSSGLGQLLAVSANLLSGLPLILLPAQILWANLVTNGLQDVALAFDPAQPGVAERPPRPPREGILNRRLLVRLFFVGLTIAVVTYGVFTVQIFAGVSVAKARTMALTTVVLAQFFNVPNSRSEYIPIFRQSLLENRFLFSSMIAALLAQLALIYWGPLRTVFRTTALDLNDWLIIVPLGLLVIVTGELEKWIARRRGHE